MSFHWPHAFWFLLVPLALALLELRRRRAAAALAHPKIIRAEAGPRQLSLEAGSVKSTARIRWRLWLGLAFATVALARPQWGRLEEPVFDQSRDIIIALDLSRSMLAEDVRPSRLERGKLLVSSLLERLAGERVGLVVFSGTAFLQSPLSADYEILRDFLPSLNPAFLPEGGSNYHALLDTALTSFSAAGSADRYLIILSDGEATDNEWKPLAEQLKTKGIRAIGLGIGTAAGGMIPDGAGNFVKDERGAVVLSKLESATLQELATTTNGVYADASTWVDLAQLIESTVATGQKGEFREKNRVRLAERFQWALAPAVLFLLWGFWREFPVRPRLRNVKLQASATPAPLPLPAATATTTAAALVLLASFLSAPHASAQESAVAEPLSKLVSQFSARDTLRPRDYAELANTTLTYGQRLQNAQRPVLEGPIRDGLAAVDAGSALDSKAADWPGLRRDLEALLRKKEPPPQNQPQQQPQQDQSKQQQQQQQDSPEQKQQEKKSSEQSQQPQSDKNESGQPPPPPQNQSAFGDMNQRSAEKADQPPPPPQPSNEMQKVGGAPEKKSDEQKDAALAVPLQKLDQLRNQDSPLKLQQLMQGQTATPKPKGKDW